jgi:hypothetical protein
VTRLTLPRTVLAGIAIVAVLASGCGTDEGESDGTAAALPVQPRLTKPEYAKEATAICLRERQRMSSDLEPFLAKMKGAEASPEIVSQALEEVVFPGFRAQYEGLRALTPPLKDADFTDLMLYKFSRSLENGEEDLGHFFRIKPSAYSEFAEGTLMTKEYGIKACGSLRRSPAAILEDF